MNPDTNKFEKLDLPENLQKKMQEMEAVIGASIPHSKLLRPDGSPVPDTWSIFTEGEKVVVKDYTFEVVRIGEGYLVLEQVGPLLAQNDAAELLK